MVVQLIGWLAAYVCYPYLGEEIRHWVPTCGALLCRRHRPLQQQLFIFSKFGCVQPAGVSPVMRTNSSNVVGKT